MSRKQPYTAGFAFLVALWTGAACASAATADSGSAFAARFWDFLGVFHPAIVHFPIALLIVAGAVELLRLGRDKVEPSRTAHVCLALGVASAVLAGLMGWSLAGQGSYGGDNARILLLHRWTGVGMTTLAVLAWVAALVASYEPSPRKLAVYRALTVIAAVLVGVTGHLGGTLVHGPGRYEMAWRQLFTTPDATAIAKAPDSGAPRAPGAAAGAQPSVETDPTARVVPGDGTVDFLLHVKPILDNSCVHCHTATKARGGLRLDVKSLAMEGGNSGPTIIPGDSEQSPLIRRSLGLDGLKQMPIGEDPLTDEQINILRAWVDAGAPWPDELAGVETPTAKHWSFVKPQPQPVPEVSAPHAPRVRNEIDSFIIARLEKENLTPSPEADRATLLRRVHLDLAGLPPTPEQVDAFAGDKSPDAYEKVVDQLLASPHYGERWAQPWLDKARYADTQGFEKDKRRSMWPYRDWVIAALNADMPFDRFTVEQIAGDLLPEPTLEQRIATGFNRNTMINEEEGVDPEEARVHMVVDRANTTATVWLGLTMACAQCHTHKYDPIAHTEYFSFYAFFNNSPVEVNNKDPNLCVRVPLEGHEQAMAKVAEHERKIAKRRAQPAATPEQEKAKKAELEAMTKQLAELRKQADARAATTLVMHEMPKPRVTRIHVGGNFLNEGDEVKPGVPAILHPLALVPTERVTSTGAVGVPSQERLANRLDLAHWLVSEDNPLTARVTVNRLWEQYFGTGLVKTSEDFGMQGELPSHPQLLDWLAIRFMQDRWSLKAMHRLIVTSATYRQSSRVTPDLLEKDPENRLLARGPRFRLDAEFIRDQALAASGLLSAKIGGPSVFPYQPDGIWNSPYSGDRWKQSAGPDQYRRGIYTFWKRSAPYPAFMTFDAPSREQSCTRRSRSNTALQALTTLNDPAFFQPAIALAQRVMTEPDRSADVARRIEHAFRLCVARGPNDREAARLTWLYLQKLAHYRAHPGQAKELLSLNPRPDTKLDEAQLAAWTVVANVLLNLDETLTKG